MPRETFESSAASPFALTGWQKAGFLALGVASLAGALAVSGPLGGPVSQASAPPRTALQKHVDFFDRNGDGKIRLTETYGGLRALGMGRARSAFTALAINAGLGSATGSPWYSFLTIDAGNIHLGKHGSDTGIYDARGDFVPAQFERMFATWDVDGSGSLDEAEVQAMLRGNRTEAGSTAARLEFELLMELAGQERVEAGQAVRVLTRERLAHLYDGTLFYELAGEPLP